MDLEWVTRSIGRCLQEGKLPSVPEERRLEQSLFHARLHPRCAVLDMQLLSAWGEAYGSAWAKDLHNMRVNNVAHLAGYFWPNASSDSRALTLIKLLQWIFLVDDVMDNLPDCPQADKLCHRLLQHIFGFSYALPGQQQLDLGGGGGGHGSCIHAKEPLIISVGVEWWKEIQASTPPKQQARFAEAFTQHLLNQQGFLRLKEKLQRQAIRSPAGLVEEYIPARRASSAFPLCVAMIEYDVGIELDEETLQNPLLQQMNDALIDHGAFINDILSFPIEFANGEMLNLPVLLHMRNNEGKAGKEEEEVPFQEAVSEAWKMAYAREKEVARLAQQLMKKKPGLERYAEAVGNFSAGLWAWTLQSPRYKPPPPPPPSSHHLPLPTQACMMAYSKPFVPLRNPFPCLSKNHLSKKNLPFLCMMAYSKPFVPLRSPFPCLSKKNLPFLSIPLGSFSFL